LRKCGKRRIRVILAAAAVCSADTATASVTCAAAAASAPVTCGACCCGSSAPINAAVLHHCGAILFHINIADAAAAAITMYNNTFQLQVVVSPTYLKAEPSILPDP